MKIKIVEFNQSYANDVSIIITRNMLEINSKDYGLKAMKEHVKNFTPDKIIEYSKNPKAKIFVALDGEEVVGTLRVKQDDRSNNSTDYIFMTIFVTPEIHNKGIGRALINKGEEYVKYQGGTNIKIPASLYAHMFYKKCGYKYKNGYLLLNDEDCIMMHKDL
jgi:GNAT superfamily N-acetyltransferase